MVETADEKAPAEDTLGSSDAVLRRVLGEGALEGDGHVPRNVRLMLFMTDLVQPYVEWLDYPSSVARSREEEGSAVMAESGLLGWDVGGALQVDETALFVMADGSGCGEDHVESAGEGDSDGSSVSVERIVSEGVRVSPVTDSDTGGSGGTIWEWNGEAGEKVDPAAATEARTTPLVTFTGRQCACPTSARR